VENLVIGILKIIFINFLGHDNVEVEVEIIKDIIITIEIIMIEKDKIIEEEIVVDLLNLHLKVDIEIVEEIEEDDQETKEVIAEEDPIHRNHNQDQFQIEEIKEDKMEDEEEEESEDKEEEDLEQEVKEVILKTKRKIIKKEIKEIVKVEIVEMIVKIKIVLEVKIIIKIMKKKIKMVKMKIEIINHKNMKEKNKVIIEIMVEDILKQNQEQDLIINRKDLKIDRKKEAIQNKNKEIDPVVTLNNQEIIGKIIIIVIVVIQEEIEDKMIDKKEIVLKDLILKKDNIKNQDQNQENLNQIQDLTNHIIHVILVNHVIHASLHIIKEKSILVLDLRTIRKETNH